MTDVAAVGIAVETDGVDKGIKKLAELAQQGPKVEQSMAGISAESKKVAKSLADLGSGAGDGLKKTGDAAQKAATGIKASGTAAREAVTDTASLARAMASLTAEEEKHIRKLVEEANGLRMTRGEMEAYRAAQRGMSTGAQEIARATGNRIEALKAEQKAISGTNDSMYALARGGMQAFIGSALVNYTLQASKAMYEASAAAQRLQTTLNYATGGNGAKELEYVRAAANKLGLEFASTAKAYAQFQAASRGTALEGDKARAVFESVAKASAVLGLSADDTGGVLRALQQMMSKGTVQAEELRGQLGERLPGAFQSAAKAMGVTTAELGKMLEQGRVISNDFLPKFAAQLEKDLGGAAEKAADRLDASVNRFANALERLKQTAGDSGISSTMQKELNAITNDVSVVTDAIGNLSKTGSGAFASLAGGAGVGAGRAAFGAFNLVVNEFNSAVNQASGGLLSFRDDLNIMPDAFRTNSEQISIMSGELSTAQARLKRLQELDAMPSNGNYYRSAIEQAKGLIGTLQEAINKKRELMAPGSSEPADPTGRTGTKSRTQSYADYNAEVKASEAEVQKILGKSAGITDDYQKSLTSLQKAKALGVLSDKAYIAAVTELAQRTWDSSTAGKEEAKAKREAASASKSAESALQKELHAYNNLVAGVQGKIDANREELSYSGRLNEAQKAEIKLNADLAAGKLKLTKAHEADLRARLAIWNAQEKAKDQTKREIEAYKEQVAAQDEAAKAYVKLYDEMTRARLAIDALQSSTTNDTERLRLEASLIGATNAQRKITVQLYDLRLERKKELQKLDETDFATAKDRAEAEQRINDIYDQRGENIKKSVNIEEWSATVQQVEDIFINGFADMMNNGKSGWESFCKSLKTSFFTLVAKQIYKMLAEPFVINIVGNLLGFTGSAAAGAAGAAASGGGMFSNLSSGLSGANALGLLGTFGGGMSAGFGGLMGSLGLTTTGTTLGGAMSAGTIAMGSGNILGGLGTFLGALGPIIGGLSLLFGGDIFGSLFGRKLKESGVEGNFGGESGFEGRLFKYYKGGVFRSNKTTYEELPEEMRSALGNQFLAMDESIRAMAGAVGLGGEALDGFTAKIKVNLKGLSEEEATKKLQEEFQKIADQMGGLVLTSEEYTRAGETQLEALTRLSTSITLANEWFKAIGDTLYSVSLAGADMASELMDAFGGADKFAAATSNYYDKFYSDQEKVANQTRLLNDALKKLGVESMPTSRDALREYINGIDLSTEAGRKLYAAMIGLADSFDVVYTSAENIAAMKEDLNVQLLRAQGKDDEATKLERAKQLKELEKYKDPELIRMQVEVWNAEDQSKKDAAAKQAAEDLAAEMAAAQKAAKDLAMKNLEAAVGREKEYWNQFSADAKDSLTKASSYFDLVTNAAKSLRESVEDGSSWAAAAGMVFIEQALANARNGGGLSDLDATKSAISAATGGLVMDNYATQAELDYDKKVLAGQLDELGGYAELAKTDAQKQIDLATSQLKRLDDTLTFWKEYGEEQVDATMSVTDAVNALYKLLDPKEQERIRKEEAEKAGLGGSGTPGKPGSGAVLGGTVSGTAGRYVLGFTADGRAKWSDGTVEKYAAGQSEYDGHLMIGSGNLNADQWAAMQAGQSVYGTGWDWDEKQGLWVKRKSFAVGTNYVPYDMKANIHQGERIIPAADNRALMAALGTQGGGNAELITAVKKLEDRLASIDHNTASSAVSGQRLDDNFNQVTEGGNGMRVVNPA